MSHKSFIIFDFGASNCRASIAGFDGKKFEIDIVHRFENNPVNVSGTLYWDILSLWQELKKGIQASFKKHKNIESIGIDTWGVDFGTVDKNNKLISNLVHYRDEGRLSVVDELFGIVPRKELFDLTGGMILPGMSSIFHLYELKKKRAPQYESACKFLLLPDLLNFFLTGISSNEYTQATTSIMLNQLEKKWEDKIFDRLGFNKDIFCDMVQPGEKIGPLKRSVSDELQTNSFSVVAPATHDTASAIAGLPILDNKKNTLIVSIGTWAIAIMENKSPVINDEVFKAGFANEGGVEGLNMFLSNITGLWISQQCMNKWRQQKGENFSWKDIDGLFPAAEPFKSFIDVDDPVFSLASSDMTSTVKDYCKLKNQEVPNTPGETARVLYENLVFKIKYKIGDIERLTSKKVDGIHVVGGGSKNKMLCQWLADSTGIALDSGPAETTSIGNLIMQLKAAKEIKNLQEGRQLSYSSSNVAHYEPNSGQYGLWQEHYEKYLRFLSKNKD